MLCSIHNVRFYQRIVRDARKAILSGDYAEFAREFLGRYRNEPDGGGSHTLSS